MRYAQGEEDGGGRRHLSRAELAERAASDVVLLGHMEPPEWLDDGLLASFTRICAQMADHGVADPMFEDAVAQLCLCSRNLRTADQMLARAISDEMADADDVAKVYRMQDTAYRQWRSLLNDMGLTPRTCGYLRQADADAERPANRFADLFDAAAADG